MRQGAVRHPPEQHGTPGADQSRLHAEQPAVHLHALPLRGLRQPRDLRRQERADPQPHRSEQPGALDGGRPQLRAVDVRERAARHLQQDPQRSAAAGVLHRDRPWQQGLQPAAGLHGHQRHRQRLRGRQWRHQSRILRFGQLAAGRRHRRAAGQPSDLVRRQLDPHQDRNAQQPPDQRRVHLQRPEHGPVARRLHDGLAQRRLPAGQPRLRLRRSRLHRRLRAG